MVLPNVNKVKRAPLYPLLAIFWFISAVYNFGKIELLPGELLAPSLLAAAVYLLTIVPLYFWLRRSWHKASLVSLVILLVCFTFGLVQQYAPDSLSMFTQTRVLLILSLLLIAGVTLAVEILPLNLHRLTPVANTVFLGLLFFNLLSIASYHLNNTTKPIDVGGAPEAKKAQLVAKPTPDVYYFVFDRYPSDKTLKEVYGYSNPLGGYFKDHKFQTLNNYANYPFTAFSLASAMNFRYLDAEQQQLSRRSTSYQPLYQMIENNQMASELKGLGYEYIHVGTRWGPTRTSRLADYNYDKSIAYVFLNRTFVPSEFMSILLRGTIFSPLFESEVKVAGFTLFGTGDANVKYNGTFLEGLHAQVFEYQANSLLREAQTKRSKPKLVFAHVLMPHEPLIFNKAGEFVGGGHSGGKKERFLEQLEFTNTRIAQITDAILKANPNSVIILQADEGPYPERTSPKPSFDWTSLSDSEVQEKFGIQSAYHLPTIKNRPVLKVSSNGPANAIRAIFNYYFGTSFSELEDRHLSPPNFRNMYDFYDYTEEVKRLKTATN